MTESETADPFAVTVEKTSPVKSGTVEASTR